MSDAEARSEEGSGTPPPTSEAGDGFTCLMCGKIFDTGEGPMCEECDEEIRQQEKEEAPPPTPEPDEVDNSWLEAVHKFSHGATAMDCEGKLSFEIADLFEIQRLDISRPIFEFVRARSERGKLKPHKELSNLLVRCAGCCLILKRAIDAELYEVSGGKEDE